MFKALLARFKEGCRTGAFPPADPYLPPDFRGRPQIDADTSAEDVETMKAVCPVADALSHKDGAACLDMGRCTFCGRCAEACAKVRFTKEYRLGVFRREDLIVRAGEGRYEPPVQTDPAAKALRGSLHLREVSAGGCCACELDANVLGTPAWDMARFGIRFAASPRHCDAIYLTGPVSGNMQLALDKTYAAAPDPKFLVVAGACAISGGLYAQGRLPSVPALYIPGCPPHPATTLEALLRFVGDPAVSAKVKKRRAVSNLRVVV
jgi:Ni,Fe-hydrogenase III small subunit